MSLPVYIMLFAGLVFFAIATVAAFSWAAKAGQFRRPREAALSIFDSAEPVGLATDAFADKRDTRRHRAAGRSLS
ncbi:MAG: cbb3-type cytochrome oxidase assembly protein [Chthoniobacterales bacterium]|nr:cbb3-type cytochrome oxidase assembly protein [Chthoniobacterales bacterium]